MDFGYEEMNHNVMIIGAGIVGFATAYNILMKKPGINLLVIEKEPEVAEHQTGNNSGVTRISILFIFLFIIFSRQ